MHAGFRAFLAASTPEKPSAPEYAAWWPTAQEDKLLPSATFAAMERCYQALDGIESHACADLMGIFRSPEYAEQGRIRLPAGMEVVGLRTDPKGLGAYLVTLHAATGIRLHFTPGAAREAREAAWGLFAAYAEDLRARVDAAGGPRDDDEPRPRAWWTRICGQVAELEGDGETMDAFGLVRMG